MTYNHDVRSLFLLLAVGLAYALLRGWPETWHAILRIFLAGSVLVAGLCFFHKQSLASVPASTPRRERGLLDLLTITAAIAGIECLLLAFLATGPANAKKIAEKLDETLHPESYRIQTTSNESSRSGSRVLISGNSLPEHHRTRSITEGKEAFQSNKPEVYLWPKGPKDTALLLKQTPYLRLFTLARYQNGTWNALALPPKTHQAQNGIVTLSSADNLGEIIRASVYHLPNLGSQGLAISPPKLLSITQESIRQTGPATFRLPPLAEDQKSYRYEITSSPRHLWMLPPEIELTIDETGLDPAYLELPQDPGIEEALRDITRNLNGGVRERLAGIKQSLSENQHYSLTPYNPDRIDPLTNFLMGSREGSCDHFSTAAALLARAAGIPSRVAYGWRGGKHFSTKNLFVFRGREAHAWTEIHLANFGWVTFETTPPGQSQGSISQAGINEQPPDSEDLIFDEEGDDELFARFKPYFLGATGVILLGFCILLILRQPKTTEISSHPSASFLPQSPSYLEFFRRACEGVKHPMPAGRTLRKHVETLRATADAPPFLEELLDYHYSVTYSGQKRAKLVEKKLITQLKEWERVSRSPQK